MATTTTLAGNSGNNLLNAPGLASTLVQGFQGNDTINLALVTDEAQAGQGNDTVGLTKSGTQVNIVDGGDGADSITFLSATVNSQTVTAGSGSDLITIGGTGLISQANIAANEGNDTINLGGARTIAQSYFGLGQGNDSITFAAGTTFTSSEVYGGKNKDTIVLGTLSGSSSTINGSDGFDLLNLAGATLTSAAIGGGRGNDSIAFGAAANTITGTVAGGGLSDTISFTGTLGAVKIFGDASGVTTAGTGTDGAADGNDVIGSTTSLAGVASIYGAGGADTIKVFSGTGLISGGDGNDSIWLGSAADLSVNGGAGDDNLTVSTDKGLIGALSTMNGGSGNDSINFLAGTTGVATLSGGFSTAANYNLVVAGSNSGDKVIFSSTALAVNTTTNWIGGVPSILIASAVTSANATKSGFITVYETGGDTYFSIAKIGGATTASWLKFVVQGADLITTTKTGNVALNSSNFAFSVSQFNSSNDTGIVFTLA